MKKDKKILNSATLFASAMLTSTMVVTAATPASGLPEVNDLGSGSEVRSALIDMNLNAEESNTLYAYKISDMKCGEGKCGEEKKSTDDSKKKSTKKVDAKVDAKKADAKKAETKKTDAKKSESKSTESKCGEGKCG